MQCCYSDNKSKYKFAESVRHVLRFVDFKFCWTLRSYKIIKEKTDSFTMNYNREILLELSRMLKGIFVMNLYGNMISFFCNGRSHVESWDVIWKIIFFQESPKHSFLRIQSPIVNRHFNWIFYFKQMMKLLFYFLSLDLFNI